MIVKKEEWMGMKIIITMNKLQIGYFREYYYHINSFIRII